MSQVFIRCYAELNDFLPAQRRQRTFPLEDAEGQTIQSIASLLGIPTAVIDLALVNGSPAPFSHPARAGDHISLYPVFESFDISSVNSLRDMPLRRPKFVADVHLGALAHYLRLLGFDTVYRNRYEEEELVGISQSESRALLSKDAGLLRDATLNRMYYVRGKDPRVQLLEVLRRFDLAGSVAPFTRCIECNTPLDPVPKEEILDRLPPKVRDLFDEFQICTLCDRIYWKGSHFGKMNDFVEGVLKEVRTG